jgi:hypothetical protein
MTVASRCPSCYLARMSPWEIYANTEVIGRWARELIMWWLFETLAAALMYAGGAPNVWSDYVFVWSCVAVFVAACVVGSLALTALRLLLIGVRRACPATRSSPCSPPHCFDADDRAIENNFWLHIPPDRGRG